MGLDRVQKTPCGFCFVEYYASEDTEAAVRYLNNLRLDDRQIRCDGNNPRYPSRPAGCVSHADHPPKIALAENLRKKTPTPAAGVF